MVGTVNVQGLVRLLTSLLLIPSNKESLLVLSWFKLVSCGDGLEEGEGSLLASVILSQVSLFYKVPGALTCPFSYFQKTY